MFINGRLIRRSLVAIAVATVASGFVGVVESSAASDAASSEMPVDFSASAACSGHGCDDQDPVISGCSSGSTVVDREVTAKGTFELRWSSRCQTNWVRTPNYAGGGSYLDLNVCDAAAGGEIAYCADFTARPTPGLHYGNMVYSPADHCAIGQAIWGSGASNRVRLTSSRCG